MQLDSDSDFTGDDTSYIGTKVEDPCDYYAGPVTLDACRCPHLDAFLPTILDSGGFGILSADGCQSHPNEVESAAGLRGNSINDFHFASLYSRANVCTTTAGPTNEVTSTHQTVNISQPILDANSNEVNRKPDRLNVKQNHETHVTTTNQSVFKHYPFGEEEYRTDALSSGGFSEYYYPILPGHLMERAKSQRILEKATLELNTRGLNERKRSRPIEKSKDGQISKSGESLYSDAVKPDVGTSGTSIPGSLCSEEEKETRVPTTTSHKDHLSNPTRKEEGMDLNKNQLEEQYYLCENRYKYLKHIEYKLSKEQELLSDTHNVNTTANYEQLDKKKKIVSTDRSAQKKQKEQTRLGISLNDNIDELSKRTKNSNLTSCPTLSSRHLPARHQSFNLSTKHNFKDAPMMANKVEEWLEVVRQTRINHWKYQNRNKRPNRPCSESNSWNGDRNNTPYHQPNYVDLNGCSYCVRCPTSSKQKKNNGRIPRGDELMRCLECSMIACGPVSLSCDQNSKQHLLQHFLVTGHSFGITCGRLGGIFCMKCGDFVYCEPLEAEKERVDIREKVGWLGWKRTGFVNRSFGFRAGLEDFLLVPNDDFPGQDYNKKDKMIMEDGDVMISDKKKLQRSKHPDHGNMVVWRGFRATYPHYVQNELVRAARRTYHRLNIFHGNIYDETSLAWSSKALQLFLLQNDKGADCWKIQKPVGFYNMGNICFMSSVLQCIMNLRPLQKYFLREAKHDHEACRELRKRREDQPITKQNIKMCDTLPKHKDAMITKRQDNNDTDICLACEMDKLFLGYYSSTIGMDVSEAIDDPLDPSSPFTFSNIDINDGNKSHIGQFSKPIDQSKMTTKISKDEKGTSSPGKPLIASDLLASAWRCKEMAHLAGYEQRDAHEFLQALLDMVGKHCKRYYNISKKLRQESMSNVHANGLSTFEVDDDSKSDIEDIVQHSFGGSLRSVLICEACGFKRSQPEPFLNVSLPVAKELISTSEINNTNSKGVTNTTTTHSVSTRRNIASKTKINLQACLNQFTSPEPLGDTVLCPLCKVKTSTLKQLTFAKLPRILCLHLKRFDALTNKKITNPVSFPVELDMGPHLPHWREVEQRKSGLQHSETPASTVKNYQFEDETCPKILYDLCSTIDHTGTLNQGHYVSNVKVDELWYHCNDAFVGRCGKGTGEEEVLSGDSAYMMFYVRKE